MFDGIAGIACAPLVVTNKVVNIFAGIPLKVTKDALTVLNSEEKISDEECCFCCLPILIVCGPCAIGTAPLYYLINTSVTKILKLARAAATNITSAKAEKAKTKADRAQKKVTLALAKINQSGEQFAQSVQVYKQSEKAYEQAKKAYKQTLKTEKKTITEAAKLTAIALEKARRVVDNCDLNLILVNERCIEIDAAFKHKRNASQDLTPFLIDEILISNESYFKKNL